MILPSNGFCFKSMYVKHVKQSLAHSQGSTHPLGLSQNVISDKQDSPGLCKVLHRQKFYLQVTVLVSIGLLPLLRTLSPQQRTTNTVHSKKPLDTPPKNTSFVHTSASCHQPLLVEGKVRKPTGYRWAVNTQVATPQTFTSLGNTNTPVLPGEAKT